MSKDDHNDLRSFSFDDKGSTVVSTPSWHRSIIAAKDLERLTEKGKTYGDSWKSRGGQGAYFVMVRKSDRLEQIVKGYGWDIFAAGAAGGEKEEGVLEQLRDLRSYCLLIEEEILKRRSGDGFDIRKKASPTPRSFLDTPAAQPGAIKEVPVETNFKDPKWQWPKGWGQKYTTDQQGRTVPVSNYEAAKAQSTKLPPQQSPYYGETQQRNVRGYDDAEGDVASHMGKQD